MYVKIDIVERLNDKCVVLKIDGGFVIMWGRFGEERPGDLIQVKGFMKNEQYHSILQNKKNKKIMLYNLV